MISATIHIARLTRAAFVFAREGVFGAVDPSLVPPPGQLALRIARLIERGGAKSGPRQPRAMRQRRDHKRQPECSATMPPDSD